MKLDLGLLVLRVGVGGLMAFSHGLPKLLGFAQMSKSFANPLGVGPTLSLTLAIFGELVCGALLALGLFTRLAAAPFVFTMLVAAFVVHADDPFAKKEFALLFAIPGLALMLTGAGRLSLDQLVRRLRAGGRA